MLIDWRWGEEYFAKKLLDYEFSSNNGNWQWAAGTGCDAAPYFRVFNPTEQVKKFDKDYIFSFKILKDQAVRVEEKLGAVADGALQPEVSAQTAWGVFYVDRIADGDLHHRIAYLDVVARTQPGKGQRQASEMQQPPEANRDRIHLLRHRPRRLHGL